MSHDAPRRAPSEGGVSERFCVLCQEDDGKTNVTAHEMVTIKRRAGGKPRRVAVCLAHASSIGSPGSPYVVAEPTRPIRARSTPRRGREIQGKSARGDISRSLRRVERYGKTQRGRLGE